MPGSQDPSLWQAITDSRFVQTLITALGMAAAVGYAVARFLKGYTPATRSEDDLKHRLETGLIEQIAHDLSDLRKGQTELRERVAAIEGFLKSDKGA